MDTSMKAALIGNPNSGKTTLFNALTGSAAHVGNWPGVTVERKEGVYKSGSMPITIVDLPGIYSLSPYTPEEVIARNYLIEENPDVVINIVDATNLERNLYLTFQVLETDCPVVIALNMIDMLEKHHDQIDIKGLEEQLGVPIIPISAAKNRGIPELMAQVSSLFGTKRKGHSFLLKSSLAPFIDEALAYLAPLPVDHKLYHAIKLVENDGATVARLGLTTDALVERLGKKAGEMSDAGDSEAVVADLRYQYINKVFSPLMKRSQALGAMTPSDKIDLFVTNKYLGIPFFLFMMFLVFHFTFGENFLFVDGLPSPGVFFQGLAEDGVAMLSQRMMALLHSVGAADWLIGLLIDGIFAGLGAVLSFLPQILILFLFLSLMEDTGYMARAAFVMDRALRGFGLSGKSFVPMVMGFGCSVPAIMATRTIEKEKDRVMTMMLIPFMSCGAKLPIYSLIAATFFTYHTDLIIFAIYFLGIVLAVLAGLILKNILFRGEPSTFIMELPPYRLPGLKALSLRLWEKLKDFIIRAGTVLLTAVVIIWFLSNFDFRLQLLPEPNSANSILGVAANAIKFLFLPLGFARGPNGWMAVSASLTGFMAKEAVVTTMGQLYAPGLGDALTGGFAEGALQTALQMSLTPAAAVSFMVFNLLTIPCIAAVSTLAKEMGSRKYFWFSLVFQFCVSWVAACVVYNIGSLFL